MSNILLALGPGDISLAHRAEIKMNELWGAKILMNERYRTIPFSKTKTGTYDHVRACSVMRAKGVGRVVLDTKLSDDKSVEMKDSINTILAEDAAASLAPTRFIKPAFMTAQYTIPRAALEMFVMRMREEDITPMINFPTSRYTQGDLERITGDVDKAVERAAQLCAELGATLMIGAIDAETAKNASPETEIVAFGGCIDEAEMTTSNHMRPALIQDTKQYVDVFGFGSTIFNDSDINKALSIRQDLIAN